MYHIADIYTAFIIDLLIGDPLWFPHPVRGIGAMIKLLEKVTVKLFGRNRFSGTLTGVSVIGITVAFVYTTIYFANIADETLGDVLQIFWLWAGFSSRSLANAADEVFKHLKSGNLSEARRSLSMIVGRDTENLNETEITAAVIETVSENSVDGIISPLFFAAIGGAPLLWAFKAISTCDSMLGYKNERYINFGTFAARVDDIANYLPARIALLIYPVAAWFSNFSPEDSFKIARRDAAIHSSPNAGIPEAATAGALHISLGGDTVYNGKVHKKEKFGKEFPPPKIEDIQKTVDLMWTATAVMLLLCSVYPFEFTP